MPASLPPCRPAAPNRPWPRHARRQSSTARRQATPSHATPILSPRRRWNMRPCAHCAGGDRQQPAAAARRGPRGGSPGTPAAVWPLGLAGWPPRPLARHCRNDARLAANIARAAPVRNARDARLPARRACNAGVRACAACGLHRPIRRHRAQRGGHKPRHARGGERKRASDDPPPPSPTLRAAGATRVHTAAKGDRCGIGVLADSLPSLVVSRHPALTRPPSPSIPPPFLPLQLLITVPLSASGAIR